ncbi:MAG: hypothetical protein A2283_22120 [Lentisphaerae bacterium RIFOXYA12_FULL_48_11]|nr:MAG: hypothetical protein A2283_22120 [Lentisphaerae bacterium RIFOXYA12_FULL_48_11]
MLFGCLPLQNYKRPESGMIQSALRPAVAGRFVCGEQKCFAHESWFQGKKEKEVYKRFASVTIVLG